MYDNKKRLSVHVDKETDLQQLKAVLEVLILYDQLHYYLNESLCISASSRTAKRPHSR